MSYGYQDKQIGLNEAEQILRDRKSGRSRLYEVKDGKVVVDHVRTANALVMFIANVPMDKWLKKIMIMRIGAPLINKRAMTPMQIALRLGMLESEVLACEEEGKRQCNEYMARCTGQMEPIPGNTSLIHDALNATQNPPPSGEIISSADAGPKPSGPIIT